VNIDRLASGFEFPEGPAIGRDGALYVTEIAGQRISRVADDGSTTVYADTGGGPNGCAFGADGTLVICNNGGRWPTDMPSTASSGSPENGPGTIRTVAPDGTIADAITEIDGVPLNSPNDVCFDDHGGYYFTDPRWGGMMGGEIEGGPVCYAAADGSTRRVADGIAFPNGLGVRDDGRTLIVCESLTGMLVSYLITEPGVLSPSSKGNGMIGRRSVPDGFCFDASGRIIVAGHGSSNLFVLDGSDGRPIDVIELPEHGPTNCCFGGDDFRTLYVTSSDHGNVFAIEWDRPGMRLFSDR